MLNALQQALRRWPAWVHFRRLHRYGWLHNIRRWIVEPQILKTRPIYTLPVSADCPAKCEVHILTWDLDWLMALWSAKSFYYFAGVDWPLIWHQGGPLAPNRRNLLLQHFPESRFVDRATADHTIEDILSRSGLSRTISARRKSFMMMKIVDCVMLSRSDHLLVLDSDVLFFQRPNELLLAVETCEPRSLFNRDARSWYNISPEKAMQRFGIMLIEQINAGLGLIWRDSISLNRIEEFLADEEILRDPWLVEQTLHALCASQASGQLLPDSYVLAQGPGLTTASGRQLVSKHYPNAHRTLLFEEGMKHLKNSGFLRVTGTAC